jgi:hypothetical protein
MNIQEIRDKFETEAEKYAFNIGYSAGFEAAKADSQEQLKRAEQERFDTVCRSVGRLNTLEVREARIAELEKKLAHTEKATGLKPIPKH